MSKEKSVRAQLQLLKSVTTTCSLETARKGQDLLGTMIASPYQNKVHYSPCLVQGLNCVWALPVDEKRNGAVLYLHGGGFTCGGVEYAKGFGAMVAAECSIRVLCATYRLAPEFPYPCALEDCLKAYRYLLQAGYSAGSILLCGESAGGGLIYSLCLKLKELGLPLPGGLLAISPWVDLTQSGESYQSNQGVDPSITKERLDYYTECYTKNPRDPFVSPLFADLRGMPPSLIFAGGDEVMLSDSTRMHHCLREAGCESQLILREGLWHAYVLYRLKEYKSEDMGHINAFLDRFTENKRKLHWMRLDNAAKIYPAARKRNWSNIFRISLSLKEPVDPVVLQSALDVTVRRFPSVGVRLRRGLFWYYLEEIQSAPQVMEDASFPLRHMPFDDIRTCAFRVLYYENRIAVEFFHSVTDGTGGTVFLKSLVAEYLTQKYAIHIPPEDGVLDRLTPPVREEWEDAFLKNAGESEAGRKESHAYRMKGGSDDGFLNVTTGTLSVKELKEKAREKGVSITVYLSAVLAMALLELQASSVPHRKKRLPVKIQIPVNLRSYFPTKSLRNFAYFFNLSIDPALGEYDFSEILNLFYHQMGLETNKKVLQSRFTTNVRTEEVFLLKLVPLFLKNLVMKAVYIAVGEKTATLVLSNLGAFRLPGEMAQHVSHADFLLNAQKGSPYSCSAVSFGDLFRFSIVGCTPEPRLEHLFFTRLVKLGLHVKIESNRREEN